MEKTFYQFGVLYLSWTNENGEEFCAVKEQVDLFGKECFEQIPEECPEGQCTEENPYKYFDEWKEEHPDDATVPFPEWI